MKDRVREHAPRKNSGSTAPEVSKKFWESRQNGAPRIAAVSKEKIGLALKRETPTHICSTSLLGEALPLHLLRPLGRLRPGLSDQVATIV